ncbi:hypothetical protein ACNPQN_41135, partial [Streptomyces sp. NPDC056297]|uniref:hypothetical protein n=1 Tax=Streptomyces sp. NPDC056297 TaxID=3345776 RepID=UPI003AAD2408
VRARQHTQDRQHAQHQEEGDRHDLEGGEPELFLPNWIPAGQCVATHPFLQVPEMILSKLFVSNARYLPMCIERPRPVARGSW